MRFEEQRWTTSSVKPRIGKKTPCPNLCKRPSYLGKNSCRMIRSNLSKHRFCHSPQRFGKDFLPDLGLLPYPEARSPTILIVWNVLRLFSLCGIVAIHPSKRRTLPIHHWEHRCTCRSAYSPSTCTWGKRRHRPQQGTSWSSSWRHNVTNAWTTTASSTVCYPHGEVLYWIFLSDFRISTTAHGTSFGSTCHRLCGSWRGGQQIPWQPWCPWWTNGPSKHFKMWLKCEMLTTTAWCVGSTCHHRGSSRRTSANGSQPLWPTCSTNTKEMGLQFWSMPTVLAKLTERGVQLKHQFKRNELLFRI